MKRKLISVMLSIAMAVTMISKTTTNIYAQDFTGWTVLTDGGTLNAGNYYLQSDVTLTNNIAFSGGDVTLDLNGYVLKGNGNGSVITVNGGNLTIQDSNPNNAHTEDFASLPTGGCITGGTGTLKGSEYLGGGIYIVSGSLVMNGGTIYNCEATKGGGVFTWGSFTMNNNSAIRDCTATVDGGGVCACDCSFIMNNNSIVSNCKANRGAGGVYIFGNPNVSSSFTMNDNSTINECEANTTLSDRCGGGVCVEGNKCSFIMNSGFITNNSAKNGGGVNVFSGTFTMNSGSINNNTVTSHGGAIAVGSGATANIVDGTIENNKATESGGAVQVDGNFTMTGGTIKNNSAIKDGGGLSVNGTIGIATLSGTTEIINNTANIKGGGVSYYGDNSGKVVLGGKVKIVGNVENGTINEGTLTGGTANNVYLYSNNLCITIGTDTYAPTEGMIVGITTITPPSNGNPIKITTNGTTSDVQHFFSDNGNYKISFNSGTVASGDEYLELKVITIADILATVDGGFPESQETSWKNNTNKNAISFVYPALSALYFTDSIKAAGENVTNNVEKEGNNYKFVDSSIGTITFNMTNNKLTSLTFEHSTSAFMDYSSLDGTYAPVVEYEITDGNKTIINIDKSEDVLFTSTADYNKFYNPDSGIIGKVLVDNELVEPINYVSAEGSTKVTLKASYLSTLSVGQHTIDIISNDGHASTTFTITKNNPSPNPRYDIPNTGVDGTYSNNHSLLKLSSLSLLAIGTYMVIKKKKNN